LRPALYLSPDNRELIDNSKLLYSKVTSTHAPAAIRTPDQRLRVFISSTMRELADERAAARDAVAQLRLTPVLFETGARPHPPRDLYRAYLDQSDVFIGIYAREYGWVAPGMEHSGIEDEYLLSGAKPRLIYVKDAPDKDERLRAMLDRIAGEGGVSYKRYKTPDDLRELIPDDLALLLAERFAAPPSVEAPPSGGLAQRAPLPSFATPLIGREQEASEVGGLLARDGVRLVTLTGPGGTGKTRLAVRVADEVAPRFAEGASFVDLSPVRHPARVASAIASALGIHEAGEVEPAEALENDLRPREMLLVLDNFEQVVEAAPMLGRMLSAAPGLRLLVTSREPLRIYGEHERPVAPLELPQAGDSTAEHGRRESVRLFVERARAVRPDFALSDENAADVAAICARLEGLPLAIELAAMRVRVLSPRAIGERLAGQLDVLSGGARDIPERQRTMRATIAWSYDLLEERERQFFARLGVFVGGFLPSGAEAVAGAGADTLDMIGSLVAKSLLRAEVSSSGEPRFRMLEMIREFALERLGEEETAAALALHARHYTQVAARWEDRLMAAQSAETHRYIDEEYGNLREALAWTLADLPQAGGDALERLVGTLYFYWYVSGRLTEGREWSERALAVAEAQGDEVAVAAALTAVGAMAMWQGRLSEARRAGERSVALLRRLDRDRLGFSLMLLGITALHQADIAVAKAALEEALAIFRAHGQEETTPICLMHLANVATSEGDLETSRQYVLQGLEIQRRLGHGWSVAWFLGNLGELARAKGDHAEAGRHYRDALALFEEAAVRGDITRTRFCLGYVALREGQVEPARAHFLAALSSHEAMGNRRGLSEALSGAAAVAAALGDAAAGARLFGASARAMLDAGAGWWPADARERERDLAALRALAYADLDAEIAAGEEMTAEEATALARATLA
jgi:predicted ATPase